MSSRSARCPTVPCHFRDSLRRRGLHERAEAVRRPGRRRRPWVQQQLLLYDLGLASSAANSLATPSGRPIEPTGGRVATKAPRREARGEEQRGRRRQPGATRGDRSPPRGFALSIAKQVVELQGAARRGGPPTTARRAIEETPQGEFVATKDARRHRVTAPSIDGRRMRQALAPAEEKRGSIAGSKKPTVLKRKRTKARQSRAGRGDARLHRWRASTVARLRGVDRRARPRAARGAPLRRRRRRAGGAEGQGRLGAHNPTADPTCAGHTYRSVVAVGRCFRFSCESMKDSSPEALRASRAAGGRPCAASTRPGAS